jgi:hypothetical protein
VRKKKQFFGCRKNIAFLVFPEQRIARNSTTILCDQEPYKYNNTPYTSVYGS